MVKLQLEEQVVHWQKILGLEEWSVDLKLVQGADVSETGWSSVQIHWGRLQATITLAEARSHKQHTCSIIHELLHVLFWPLWQDFKQTLRNREPSGVSKGTYEVKEERIIKRLVDALYGQPTP